MNLTRRRNGGAFPSLLSNIFDTSLSDGDFFDFNLLPSRVGNIPMANVVESPKAYTIELAAPGLERKDFNVEVENRMLRISAEKEGEYKEENEEYCRKEYSYSTFSRSFALPENVKEGSIDAKYESGILKVVIPKAKETPVKSPQKVLVS